jgi:hypothetical protein
MSIRMLVVFAACTIAASTVAATPDATGERPGDASMTCEEIATELAPYAQQIMPSLQAYGASVAQLNQQSRAVGEQRKIQEQALLPLATAGAVDPTGAAKKAYELALMAQMAKERAENEALANSPLAKQGKAQGDQMAAQAKELQANARLQRLMQLAQDKHCDKR